MIFDMCSKTDDVFCSGGRFGALLLLLSLLLQELRLSSLFFWFTAYIDIDLALALELVLDGDLLVFGDLGVFGFRRSREFTDLEEDEDLGMLFDDEGGTICIGSSSPLGPLGE